MTEHERVTHLVFMQVGRTVKVGQQAFPPNVCAEEWTSPAGWCRGRAPFRGPS